MPVIEGVKEFAMMGMVPAGAHKNRVFCESDLKIHQSVERVNQDILFDPQTSGGLVVSMNKKEAEICLEKLINIGVDAEIIGEVDRDDSQGLLEII